MHMYTCFYAYVTTRWALFGTSQGESNWWEGSLVHMKVRPQMACGSDLYRMKVSPRTWHVVPELYNREEFRSRGG